MMTNETHSEDYSVDQSRTKFDLTVFKQFFELSHDLMCVAGVDGYFKLVNPSFVELLGFSESELLGSPIINFVHPDDLQNTQEEIDSIRETSVSKRNFQNRYFKKNGEIVHLEWVSTTEDTDGLIYAVARDITDRKKMNERLMRNEKLFNASQSVAKLGNFSYNTKDHSLYWSSELFNIFGIKDEERDNLLEAYMSRFDEEGISEYERVVGESMKSGDKYAFKHKVHIPGGPVKVVSCVGVPFMDEYGEIYRIDGVVQDITSEKENEFRLKQSLSEKEFLIKELHHRVKNNLQVISSLLRLQAEMSGDQTLKDSLLDSRNRIHSMASVHNLLYRSEDLGSIDFGHYLKKLTDDLGMSYFGTVNKISVDFHVDEIALELEKAIPLGILMNELISNAFKHAFDDHENAKLKITIEQDPTLMSIKIEDNGKGFNERSVDRKNSLGLNLIDSLAEQLSSEIKYASTNAGTSVFLSVPKN